MGFSAAEAALTIDLRLTAIDGVAAQSSKNATVSHLGQVFTFDLFARVTSPEHANDVDFNSLQGSFISENAAGGFAALGSITPAGLTTGGPTPSTLVAVDPFAANGARNGDAKDLDGDGDLDLGDNNSSDTEGTLGFVAFRTAETVPPTITPGGVSVPDGKEWLVGRIQFTVDNAAAALGSGTTNINFYIRRDLNGAIAEQAALWSELPGQGGVMDGLNGETGSIVIGAPVVLTRQQQSSQWNVNGSGSWSDTGSWSGAIPNGIGATANFLGVPQGTAAPVVSLNGDKTVGQIVFDNTAASYTIAPGAGGKLTVDNGSNAGIVNVANGNHTIDAPLAFAAGKVVNRIGGGTLNITGTQSHGDGAVFNATAGTTNFNSDGGSNLTINVGNSDNPAVVNFNASQALLALNLGAKGKAKIAGAGKVLDVTNLTFSGDGQLDLDRSNAIVRHSDSDHGAAKTAYLIEQVLNGIAGGAQGWDGPGIVSSDARNNPIGNTTVAVFNNDDGTGAAILSDFAGRPVDANSILLKYTYFGDCNLDGEITGDDYALIDFAWQTGLKNGGWLNGDINYDGEVTGDDYALMDVAWQTQGQPLSALINLNAVPSAVPEPGTLGLLAAATLGLMGRRRRAR